MDATDIGERAQPDKHRIRDAWYDMFLLMSGRPVYFYQEKFWNVMKLLYILRFIYEVNIAQSKVSKVILENAGSVTVLPNLPV